MSVFSQISGRLFICGAQKKKKKSIWKFTDLVVSCFHVGTVFFPYYCKEGSTLANRPIRLNMPGVTSDTVDSPTSNEIWSCFKGQEQTLDNPFSSTGLHSHRGVTASVVKVRKKMNSSFLSSPLTTVDTVVGWILLRSSTHGYNVFSTAYSFIMTQNRKTQQFVMMIEQIWIEILPFLSTYCNYNLIVCYAAYKCTHYLTSLSCS